MNIYKDLIRLKEEPSFSWGDFRYLIVNDDIFSFERHASGFRKYAVLMNLSNRTISVDLSDFNIPREANVKYVFGADPQETSELRKFYSIGQRISTRRILLNHVNCIILSY